MSILFIEWAHYDGAVEKLCLLSGRSRSCNLSAESYIDFSNELLFATINNDVVTEFITKQSQLQLATNVILLQLFDVLLNANKIYECILVAIHKHV